MKYTPIIGLEVHVELGTTSKMFCSCPADYFGKKPNTQCCPVCLGLPGALPVPNKKAIEQTILFGLAVHSTIAEESKFDRKNYFYPDLPKGYQISQYDEPLAMNGSINIKYQMSKIKNSDQKSKIIRIRRVHIEEDTGKLQHMVVGGKNVACIDFNRSGVPLMEIVTEPDFRSVDEVDQYVRRIQQIIRYLGISGADMERGSMRIEPSISLLDIKYQKSNIKDEELPKYRVEIKNINSFRFVRKALEYEIVRQTRLLESGVAIDQETRGYSETQNVTVSQRGKEDAMDYRYFPEPDIPPMRFTQDQILKIKDQISELPDQKSERFIREYGLTEYDTDHLIDELKTAVFFEKCVIVANTGVFKKANITPKIIANWIINKKTDLSINESQFIQNIASSLVVMTVSDEDIYSAIKHVLRVNVQAVEDFKAGKDQVKMFLFGNVIKELKGKGDKQIIMELLIKELRKI
ncbi:Asp-tRNA(Asn)/Glu-tRNA(Gln) amidotransferase subunit GatB [Candidatus Gottesmanbacteria bacterium]|nr:Asp-tRNA(Asn)/Glu-tRNA(Gln) amidotransferase subunit GatB [Candidatus Gottesmanbacteria bacterium]